MNLRRSVSLLLLGTLLWLGLAGCGEKIAIPVPSGLFSSSNYHDDLVEDVADLRGLATASGQLFVLTGTELQKRNQNLEVLASVDGFGDATAVCVAQVNANLFVWDQASRTVSWYRSSDLMPPEDLPGSTELPAVQRCVAMATGSAGIEQVPGAITYLYLSDPDSGVVHRYALDPYVGLRPHGILCRDGGDGARFVNEPAGLARDASDSLLVCDVVADRHWVIRFNAIPDLTDTAVEGTDPLRGTAALFRLLDCSPQPAAAYALGNAPGCDAGAWVPGPSDSLGFFDTPRAVAVDSEGNIYVADQLNNRVQIFGPDGVHQQTFGDADESPGPFAIAVSDVEEGNNQYIGGVVWIASDGVVRKFLSADYYDALNALEQE